MKGYPCIISYVSTVDNQGLTHKSYRELDLLYITKEKVYMIYISFLPQIQSFAPETSRIQKIDTRTCIHDRVTVSRS